MPAPEESNLVGPGDLSTSGQPKDMATETHAKNASAMTDLAQVASAVNDASSRTTALWLSFLTFLAYLTMAVGSVTHVMLFRESPIKLPVLNVDLPLVAFFWIAPIFFVLFHFYLFLQILILVRKASAYDALLRATIKDKISQEEHRNRLDTFIILQLLFGGQKERAGVTALLLRLIAFITLVAAPIALLLQFQLVFLPYHHATVTAVQRVMILLDGVIICAFWFAILRRDRSRYFPKFEQTSEEQNGSEVIAKLRGVSRRLVRYAGIALLALPTTAVYSAAAVIFSWFIFTYPSEKYALMPAALGGPVNMVEGKPEGWFSNVLVITYKKLVADEKTDKAPAIISVRGRDLSGAILIGSDMHGIDFIGSNLNNARLDYANLTGARLIAPFRPEKYPWN